MDTPFSTSSVFAFKYTIITRSETPRRKRKSVPYTELFIKVVVFFYFNPEHRCILGRQHRMITRYLGRKPPRYRSEKIPPRGAGFVVLNSHFPRFRKIQNREHGFRGTPDELGY